MPKLTVYLNGTDTNPFQKWGLRQNPFPQLARAETDIFEHRLNKLGGDPIPRDRPEAYIREVLAGFSTEFIDLCVAKYRPGEMVQFVVHF